ncbi:MAG TPA: MBL fold metallo-hydrolase [Caulobacteraceae bacterium]|jgi:flavorubredoxin
MATRIDEIADGIFRISTLVPEIAPPAGFGFNQFLVMADEPLLFHCGMRGLFPAVSAAVATVTPIGTLRWISFGHVEADECGAMNAWLAAAPQAQVVHGMTACMVSLNDLADRPPRALADGEVLDLGGKRVRWIDTPHVPHAWESGLMFEETTGTLFCGDLFTHAGDGPPVTREDITPAAIATEEAFRSVSLGPALAPTVRALKRLAPKRLATMHGSCFEGDGNRALDALADYLAEATASAAAR